MTWTRTGMVSVYVASGWEGEVNMHKKMRPLAKEIRLFKVIKNAAQRGYMFKKK